MSGTMGFRPSDIPPDTVFDGNQIDSNQIDGNLKAAFCAYLRAYLVAEGADDWGTTFGWEAFSAFLARQDVSVLAPYIALMQVHMRENEGGLIPVLAHMWGAGYLETSEPGRLKVSEKCIVFFAHYA